ncbi:MAG: acyl-CoA/acyl-ACP dehydrogenase [Actinomycetota bacterium]|nr:acyl-CoA/acyl-ACP dehydrogenase [Actinomycetota bacterium]
MTSNPADSNPADSNPVDHDVVGRARALADDVLFPHALEVDASTALPRAALDEITERGLYGLVGPTHLGGAGANQPTQLLVIEALASGCLNTAFVWTQHQGATNAAVTATGEPHEQWAAALSSGRSKGGVAFAHLLRPRAVLTAEPTAGGWLLSGVAPWVTGWGYIDVVLTGARVGADAETGRGGDIVWLLVDAVDATTLRSIPLRLSAANASGTFEIGFDRHFVPDARVTSIQPYDQWRAEYPKGLRLNGSLGLGVATRTASLLGPSVFDAALLDVRHQLDRATVDQLPTARGRLGALAVKMTAALVATTGGRSILADQHGQRLAREAMFLLIQGQTPEIRDAQLADLAP